MNKLIEIDLDEMELDLTATQLELPFLDEITQKEICLHIEGKTPIDGHFICKYCGKNMRAVW